MLYPGKIERIKQCCVEKYLWCTFGAPRRSSTEREKCVQLHRREDVVFYIWYESRRVSRVDIVTCLYDTGMEEGGEMECN